MTDTTNIVTPGKHGNEDNEEKKCLAIAAMTALPEWVHAAAFKKVLVFFRKHETS